MTAREVPERDQAHATQPWPVVAAVAAASVAVAASFLPWARSGEASRSSYELVSVVVRLEVLPEGTGGLARIWYALPALLGCAWVAVAAVRPRLAATLTAVVGLLSVVAAYQTMRSPLVAEAGASLALGAGVVAMVAATFGLLKARRQPR
jgi:hypothetical protein